jgi:hypothetical protein
MRLVWNVPQYRPSVLGPTVRTVELDEARPTHPSGQRLCYVRDSLTGELFVVFASELSIVA